MMPRSSFLKVSILALALSFVVLGNVYAAADPAQESLVKADALLKAGKSAETIIEANKAISLNPKSAFAFYLLGSAYKNLNKPETAFSAFNTGLELVMNQPDQSLTMSLHFARGETLRMMGRGACDLALADLTMATQLNPKFARLFQVRGFIYLDLKDYDKALEDFSKTLQINPGLSDVYENLGATYLVKKDYAKAWDNFHKAERAGFKVQPSLLDTLKKESGKDA